MKHDDAVGFAEAVGAEHHAGVPEEAHPSHRRSSAAAPALGPAAPARSIGPGPGPPDGRPGAGSSGHGPVRVLAVQEVAPADEDHQGHDGDQRGQGVMERR